MGRKRYKQTQSARIFFKEKDHREVIMDDVYHNAIYIDNNIEPAWRKYKRNTWLAGTLGDDHNNFYSLDFDNKILFAKPVFNTTNRVDNLGIGTNVFGMISKNGYDFKEGSSDVNYRFGSSNYCEYQYDPSQKKATVSIYGINYSKGQKRANVSTVGTVEIDISYAETMTSNNSRFLWVCLAKSGAIFVCQIRTGTAITSYYYHVTSSGYTTIQELVEGFSEFRLPDYNNALYVNGTYVIPFNIGATSNSRFRMLYVRTFTDSDMSTWTKKEIKPSEATYYTSTTRSGRFEYNLSYKGGYYYFYVKCFNSYTKNAERFVTQYAKTQSFDDVEFSDINEVTEIKFWDENDDIKGYLQTSSYKKVAIRFANPVDSTYQPDSDTVVYDFNPARFMEGYNFNYRLSNGKYSRSASYLSGIESIYDWESGYSYICYVFADLTLNESSSNFAFAFGEYSYDTGDVVEEVEEDDWVNDETSVDIL